MLIFTIIKRIFFQFRRLPNKAKTSYSHAQLSLSEEPSSSVLLLPVSGASSGMNSTGQELSSPVS